MPLPAHWYTISLTLLLSLSSTVWAKKYTTIEWVDLIPQEELAILSNPPEAITGTPHNPGAASSGSLKNTLKNPTGPAEKVPTPEEQAYFAALESTNINTELNQKDIRLPGFIVPVEYNDAQIITEFFLVPYFGACIHVPPPPPNQIIYVKYPQGLSLTALYDPFWIEGQLNIDTVKNDIATSAYGISADTIKPYEEYNK